MPGFEAGGRGGGQAADPLPLSQRVGPGRRAVAGAGAPLPRPQACGSGFSGTLDKMYHFVERRCGRVPFLRACGGRSGL